MGFNRLRDVVTGLAIFLENGGSTVDPAHDELRSGQANGIALAATQIQLLTDAGWFRKSDECECERAFFDEDAGEEAGSHEPTCNEWMIFT